MVVEKIKLLILIIIFCILSSKVFCQPESYKEKYDPIDKQRLIRITLGVQGGPSTMLANFRYSNPQPELKQPIITPAYSFWRVFLGVQFSDNTLEFSRAELPTSVGYSINTGAYIYSDNLLTINYVYSISYLRDLTGFILGWLSTKKRWKIQVGGFIAMGLYGYGGGTISSMYLNAARFKLFEMKGSNFMEGDFILFGPVLQLRRSVSSWFKIFGDARLQITPYSPRSYELSYKVYPRPTPISEPFRDFKTTRVSSYITNLSFSFGILFEFGVGRRM